MLRGTGDLTFEFTASGKGSDEHGEQQVFGDWHHRVSGSDWIGQLRTASARDVLLLEVPIPLKHATDKWRAIAAPLQRAEEQYRSGDYHSCIGSCRTAMEELGIHRYRDREWAGKVLGRLASRSTREDMDKAAREAAVYAVLRHYTHLAHHGLSEGGIPAYTRAEAEFACVFSLRGRLGGGRGEHQPRRRLRCLGQDLGARPSRRSAGGQRLRSFLHAT